MVHFKPLGDTLLQSIGVQPQKSKMKKDERSIHIGRKARSHLALLPRSTVLRSLADQILHICREGASSDETIALINKMLCHIERPGEEAIPYRTVSCSGIVNPSGMFLYRARKGQITEGASGCWAPPKPLAKPNRLNRAGEQVLYASTQPVTASREVGVLSTGKRETFSLIVYEIIQDMSLSRIGSPPFPPKLEGELKQKLHATSKELGIPLGENQEASRDDVEKIKILTNFLKEMFSGPEAWYPVSQHLCRYFFPLPRGFDGWLYPCIQQDMEDVNVCLLDEHARLKLRILEVLTLETRFNRKPVLKCTHRPEGDGLVRVQESHTLQEVLSDKKRLGFWNECALDYVESGDIQWPSQ